MTTDGDDRPVIRLPWPPNTLSPNGSQRNFHARTAAKKAYKDAGYIACCEVRSKIRLPHEGPITLELDFVPPPKAGAQRLDKDNLIARMKAGLDGIAQALHIDDERFAAPLVAILAPAQQANDAGVLVRLAHDHDADAQ